MFNWDKTVKALELPASSIIHLFRSMREVQLALPGELSQQASAYLCQYQSDEKVGTVVVFHLHKSNVLAFYFSDPRLVAASGADSMLDQGLNFVESMGFLMTDQDIHLLDKPDQEMLWSSLPLMSGLPVGDEQAETKAPSPPQKRPVPEPPARPAATAVEPPLAKPEEPAALSTKAETPQDVVAETEDVDDLLAAVEALRARRPGLRARKTPPSAEDMERRKIHLRETVGRILASM